MIESPRNKLLKDIRRLRRCKGDLAVLEGPHLVREALAAGLELETILLTPEMAESADPDLLSRLGAGTRLITPEALRTITDTDSPRGLLAVARLSRGGLEAVPRRSDGVYVYLDGLQDPGNLGAIARVAEATRVTGLILAEGAAHPNHPRALRASAGSLLRLPVAMDVALESLAKHLEGLEARWIALSTHGEHDLYAANLRPPLVLVVGAERGLDSALEAWCEDTVRIPTAEPVDSLNIAVAAALALFEIRRQQE